MDFKYVKNKDWYIPDIQCSVEGKKRNIGKYGRLREKFLKESRKAMFDHLVASEAFSFCGQRSQKANQYDNF